MKKTIILLTLFCVVACMQQKIAGSRDKKSYKTVKIGEQVWMAENLNYEVGGSKCYGEGNSNYSASEVQANCNKYGRLYDWTTAMGLPEECKTKKCTDRINTPHQGICPSGWHIPSNAEWEELLRYVDNSTGTENPYKSPYAYSSKTAGKHLKAASGWNWNDSDSISGNGLDTYGFSALPGGVGPADGYFCAAGDLGFWWSSSEDRSCCAYLRNIMYKYEGVDYADYGKRFLYSVRCLRD
jgi:uncharacterized protein (TIGR02145 family)